MKITSNIETYFYYISSWGKILKEAFEELTVINRLAPNWAKHYVTELNLDD
ncbi:hypothetical protein HYE23_00895 [Mycoplasmopsis bovis]|nr:hypothetical protein [Mycoplasmopsis bovis]QQH23838.1 hypothetical protein HYE23_00895 [Mycoplasmopsis bovis]